MRPVKASDVRFAPVLVLSSSVAILGEEVILPFHALLREKKEVIRPRVAVGGGVVAGVKLDADAAGILV